MAGADIFYHSGRIGAIPTKLCRLFQLRPYVAMRQKKAVMLAMLARSLERAWRQGISFHLRRKRKICQEVVYITYTGCNVKQQQRV